MNMNLEQLPIVVSQTEIWLLTLCVFGAYLDI